MEVGSSHTTTMMSWAARVKLNTMSEIPAAVSTSSTSTWVFISLKARMSSACCTGDSSTMDWVPEVAGTIIMP